jgi:hypothetical protein
MRLPMLGGMDGDVDLEQMKQMVDLFMPRALLF